MKVVVAATDFSESGQRAVNQAVALCRHHDARLFVVYADQVAAAQLDEVEQLSGLPEPFRVAVRERLRAAEENLSALAKDAVAAGVTTEARLIDGYPEDAISAFSDEVRADLLVIGGGTPIHGLLGTSAHRVIRSTRNSVLLVRGEPVAKGYSQIVCATDFSPAATEALRKALTIAAPSGAHCELFHCVEVGGGVVTERALRAALPSRFSDMRARAAADAQAEVEQMSRRFAKEGVEIEGAFDFGPVRAALAKRLEREPAPDLVAVGAHGKRGWRDRMLGSVADHLVRFAACSVLIASE